MHHVTQSMVTTSCPPGGPLSPPTRRLARGARPPTTCQSSGSGACSDSTATCQQSRPITLDFFRQSMMRLLRCIGKHLLSVHRHSMHLVMQSLATDAGK